MSDAVLILTNLPDAPSAQALARQLVERKLAACVNILPAVQAVYRWQGVIEREREVLLLAKTIRARFDELEREVRALHSYKTPEIVALPVAAGSERYLKWLGEETKSEKV